MVLAAACSDEPGAIPTATSDASPATTSESANDLAGFDRAEVALGAEAWTVAVADTPALRAQGLMDVTDLRVDGMLFVFEDMVQVSFHMLDTLIPLDIAFFADDGSLVDRFTMIPCDETPCPTYPGAGPARYVIETAVGGFDGIEPLVLDVSGLER